VTQQNTFTKSSRLLCCGYSQQQYTVCICITSQITSTLPDAQAARGRLLGVVCVSKQDNYTEAVNVFCGV